MHFGHKLEERSKEKCGRKKIGQERQLEKRTAGVCSNSDCRCINLVCGEVFPGRVNDNRSK